MFIGEHDSTWDEKLPLPLMSYRSVVHDTIGYTPSMLVYGRDITMPVDLVWGCPDEQPVKYCKYVADLRDPLESVHEFARSQTQLTHARAKRHCDLPADHSRFDVGDAVWMHNLQRKKGTCPKLPKQLDGPYCVADQINDVMYRKRRGPRNTRKLVPKNRLRPDRGAPVETRWAAIDSHNPRQRSGPGPGHVATSGCQPTAPAREQSSAASGRQVSEGRGVNLHDIVTDSAHI